MKIVIPVLAILFLSGCGKDDSDKNDYQEGGVVFKLENQVLQKNGVCSENGAESEAESIDHPFLRCEKGIWREQSPAITNVLKGDWIGSKRYVDDQGLEIQFRYDNIYLMPYGELWGESYQGEGPPGRGEYEYLEFMGYYRENPETIVAFDVWGRTFMFKFVANRNKTNIEKIEGIGKTFNAQ